MKFTYDKEKDTFSLIMNFYEANEMLCQWLPCAEASLINDFKKDVECGESIPDWCTRRDKEVIRRVRWLQETIQGTFDKRWESKED